MAGANLTTPQGDRIAVVSGLRSPFAKLATAYRGVPALELGSMVVNELVKRTELDTGLVEQLVYGQVVQMPAAPNIAREITLACNFPVSVDAYSVTRACATSFQATANVIESMMMGHTTCGIAGGADSASVSPIGVSKNLAMILTDLTKAKTLTARLRLFAQLRGRDLLPVAPAVAEYSTGLSMGQTAEQMAKSHGISRVEQDELAHRSHQLATKAWQQGYLTNQVMTACLPSPPYQSKPLEQDNNVRTDSTLASYQKLKPIFDRTHGSVTAGNSTPLTDGASAVLLMTESRAKSLGYRPLGYIKSYAFTATRVDHDMLMGPSFATPIALDRAKLTLNDLDLIEIHEAFAAQTLANVKCFGSKIFAQEMLNREQAIGEIDMDKFNVLGSSIAYGHPFAATGTRMITQMLHELKRRGGGMGLVTACAAGGLGAAMVVEAE